MDRYRGKRHLNRNNNASVKKNIFITELSEILFPSSESKSEKNKNIIYD